MNGGNTKDDLMEGQAKQQDPSARQHLSGRAASFSCSSPCVLHCFIAACSARSGIGDYRKQENRIGGSSKINGIFQYYSGFGPILEP